MNSKKEYRCLVMFAKFPEGGQVKSRLAKDLGEERAAELYRCFIDDLLERLSRGNYRFQMAFYPANKEREIREMFGNEFSYIPQAGQDLGERMKNAFNICFSQHSQDKMKARSPQEPPAAGTQRVDGINADACRTSTRERIRTG